MNGEMIKSSCIILEKCLKNSFKTFVQLENEDTKEILNKTLWTFAQKSFIPHGSDLDPSPEKQPIYISTKNECPIKANMLMLIGKYRLDVGEYERVIIMVDGNSESDFKKAQEMREALKNLGHNIEYYRQNSAGGWGAE
jgi:DNA polymerase-3 subunit chi